MSTYYIGPLLLASFYFIASTGLPLRAVPGFTDVTEDTHLCSAEKFIELSQKTLGTVSVLTIADVRVPRLPVETANVSFDLPLVDVHYNGIAYAQFQASPNETLFESVHRYTVVNGYGSDTDIASIFNFELAVLKTQIMIDYLSLIGPNSFHSSQPLGKEYYRTSGLSASIIVPHWGICHRRASDVWIHYLPLFDFKDRPIRYLEIGVNY